MPVSRPQRALAVVLLLMLGGISASAAQGAHPFGVPESGAGLGGPGWLAGFFGQVSVWQTHFYRQLTAAVRAWQADGGAWLLIGLSFAYGVFHALGPGHGKAVIASYVLANRQTARNGALLALASSLIQALVAIVMVAVLAVVFNATAATMNEATRWLELASYALVTLLGVWLVWIKAVRPLLRRAGARGHAHDHAHAHDPGHAQAHAHAHAHANAEAHAHHHGYDPNDHHHDHDCGCGHAHVPAPEQVAGPLNWRRAWSASSTPSCCKASRSMPGMGSGIFEPFMTTAQSLVQRKTMSAG